jgi:putative transposase
MPYRKFVFQAGDCYHLYNRGNNCQTIFYERENYHFFLRQLCKYFQPEAVELVAYCLMPNYYYLLVHLVTDDLSSLMQRFALSYTKAINKRYGRVGSLFQGRFRAVCVDRDEYMVHLSRYIHLNPVTAKLVERPEDWEFSSYREYIGLRAGTLPKTEAILSQFSLVDAYRVFVESHVGDNDGMIGRSMPE